MLKLRFRFWLILPLLWAFSCCTRAGLGAIVLDEFNDPFSIALPAASNSGQYTIQNNIGPLSAQRWAGATSNGASPTGFIDANISQSSALTISVDRMHPVTPTTGVGLGINFIYYVAPTDVSQAGLNDRVRLDFGYLRSNIPLAQVVVYLADAADNYGSEQFNIAPTNDAFHLDFPFNTFFARGGGAGGFDPTQVRMISLNITPVFLRRSIK